MNSLDQRLARFNTVAQKAFAQIGNVFVGLGTAGFQHSIALAPRNVQTDIAVAIAFERDRRSMLPIVTVGNRTIYYQVSGPLRHSQRDCVLEPWWCYFAQSGDEIESGC